MDELENLKTLRKWLFDLQDKYLTILCGDDDKEDTPIQRQFGFLIWEIDQRTRKLSKMKKP